MSVCKGDIPNLNIKIHHRNWQNALSQAFAVLSIASPGEIVCITGPSRVGKSRLANELRSLLEGENNFSETGCLPVVSVQANNTGQHGSFSTKSFTLRMLDAVRHPIFSCEPGDTMDLAMAAKWDRVREGALRDSLERALKMRKTKYLFIDEAHHAKYSVDSLKSAQAVLDSWKCLAQGADVVLVLIAAYPILSLLRNSPHMLGRKHQIHFPRYQLERNDIEQFGLLIAHYEQALTLDSSLPSLRCVADLLYENSFGCVGLLRNLLARAAAFAHARGECVTEEILKEVAPSDDDKRVIMEEIMQGESLLSGTADMSLETGTKKMKVKSSVKPFRRKPRRMRVGNRMIDRQDA